MGVVDEPVEDGVGIGRDARPADAEPARDRRRTELLLLLQT